MSPRYEVRFSKSAKRALTHDLPEKVAAAAFEFITGALSENPHRVGKQLKEPLFPLYSARRGDYRVIYRIEEDVVLVEIVSIAHRGDAYR
ncbi:type II toxin-antitoxin system RelE/ParE family toxin [Arthrobacter sp. KBS0703]|uniref:type II toxin-antitoxin system RelE family toxin n=1 Tax=Arthrobacter sp. KBS0703 TaxID=1955698 RepID=UPI00098EF80B|nr:type II toxin-antitoxin system RelE/ParE family toxin [Arthrobacter sp. KBS0703]TSE15725.1 type II toxin-antitoxin system RelE/ParE family toxin [Arthrobacter sp. KBS0703]